MSIYLDYAASSPLRPEVMELLGQLYQQPWGNPSSQHRSGHRARMAVEQAREHLAGLLGAKVEELIFTSGATEANNLAVLGWMRQFPPGSHLIVSALEHPSVREAARALTFEGYELDLAPLDSQGLVQVGALLDLIRPETRLVSLVAVNNEIGVRQPLQALLDARAQGPWKLHVDGVQAGLVGWPSLEAIDFFSLSAHKLGGPVGVGCLYVKQGLRLAPLLVGGGQEDQRRAGTLNPVAIQALALAAHLTRERRAQEAAQVLQLRQTLEERLLPLPGATLLGQAAPRSPHISSWLFRGVRAESLLVSLDLAGIAASSGSACSSHSLEPSRLLLAMGYTPEESQGLVRFSLGHASRPEDIQRLLQVLLPRLG